MNDAIYHFGVLGMKWGVRKDRNSSRGNRKKNSVSKIKKTISDKRKKVSIKSLSDEDLQKKINRLQMEKKYRDLKRDELSEGAKLAGDILRSVGKGVGIQVGTYAAAKAINGAMKQEIVVTKSDKKKDK